MWIFASRGFERCFNYTPLVRGLSRLSLNFPLILSRSTNFVTCAFDVAKCSAPQVRHLSSARISVLTLSQLPLLITFFTSFSYLLSLIHHSSLKLIIRRRTPCSSSPDSSVANGGKHSWKLLAMPPDFHGRDFFMIWILPRGGLKMVLQLCILGSRLSRLCTRGGLWVDRILLQSFICRRLRKMHAVFFIELLSFSLFSSFCLYCILLSFPFSHSSLRGIQMVCHSQWYESISKYIFSAT